MDSKDLTDLQDPESWDFRDDAAVRGTTRKSRAVVSVAFPANDFERVEAYAKTHGLKVSELIRGATLQHVDSSKALPDSRIVLMSAGVSLEMTAYFPQAMPSTGVSSASFLEPDVAVT